MGETYLFTSERLGFREWQDDDIPLMAAINADEKVMEFFSGVKSYKETEEFVKRMQKQFIQKGYCYFAVEELESVEFIGFIGISEQTFVADFTPCTDIGWRLHSDKWGKGYATEGAKRCLEYGFEQPGLERIYAIAPKINARSERIMNKTGMRKVKEFMHPLLANNERLKECVLYEITR